MSRKQISDIHVISTIRIKLPLQPESTAKINLTPWDLQLLFIGYCQKGLLFLKPTSQTGPTASLVHHLKLSFERALRFFPPLAGRLATAASEDARRFFIDCNHEEGGALFVHTAANDVVSGMLRSADVPEIVRSLFPLAGARNIDGVSQPLLAVQVTELADGLFVGCSVNHLVADGASFWHFINAWAEISRGESGDRISRPPLLDRDRVALDLAGTVGVDIPSSLLPSGENPNPEKHNQLRDRVFRFTRRSVIELKSKANREAAGIGNGGVGIQISSLQAIVAHVWRSIIRCRFKANPTAGETTSFVFPIGARQRLRPPLPDEYFGNSVFAGTVMVEIGEMLGRDLGWAAWRINRMVGSCDGPDKVRDLYVDWIRKPEFIKCDGPHENQFTLMNSPRFNVYGNDFGWGKPVAVRNGGSNRFDRRITVYRGEEEGSVEIEACLDAQTLCHLKEDKEFMEYVTS